MEHKFHRWHHSPLALESIPQVPTRLLRKSQPCVLSTWGWRNQCMSRRAPGLWLWKKTPVREGSVSRHTENTTKESNSYQMLLTQRDFCKNVSKVHFTSFPGTRTSFNLKFSLRLYLFKKHTCKMLPLTGNLALRHWVVCKHLGK